ANLYDTPSGKTNLSFNPEIIGYNDYYPFGMLVPNRHGQADSYRYGFNGKENDDEVVGEGNWQEYGMRMYDPRLGRFPNVDPLTKKYPELTPYQFASNTPIQAIDLDGLEAFYVHGTWSNPSTFPQLTISKVNDIFNNTTGAAFDWTGFNSDKFRKIAGRKLAEHIIENRDPGQALTLVGHSHGGNVAIIAANILENEYDVKVDNILTINTPVREYQLDSDLSTLHFNVFHKGDPVQANGGNSIVVPDDVIQVGSVTIPVYYGGQEFPKGELGKAGRKFEGAFNIQVEGFQNWNPKNFHDTHTRPELFETELKSTIDNIRSIRSTVNGTNKSIRSKITKKNEAVNSKSKDNVRYKSPRFF
ncbi:RHS repeat-associated core domain-containing protein, partial [Tenacibaculum maritimum]|uniref:RHS repeat-associated core domain-containing protein n=1 Tax=Tenacibaculum maritimum TaxID=107401 RepID=UPI001E3FAF96